MGSRGKRAARTGAQRAQEDREPYKEGRSRAKPSPPHPDARRASLSLSRSNLGKEESFMAHLAVVCAVDKADAGQPQLGRRLRTRDQDISLHSVELKHLTKLLEIYAATPIGISLAHHLRRASRIRESFLMKINFALPPRLAHR